MNSAGAFPPLRVAAEPDELERLADPSRLLGLVDLALAQPVPDVLGDVHVREQRVVLEDGVDVAPVRRHAGDRLAVQENLALGGLLEAGDHAQGRGLAAARWSEKAVELAMRDAQVHVVDGNHVPETLGDIDDLNVGGRRARVVEGGHTRCGGRNSVTRLGGDGDGQRRASRSVRLGL